jgi:molybdopterin/thiamine biosynthesis adenylyltransferase
MRIEKNCEEFYQLRDRRSVEYLGRAIGDLVPVHVTIDAATAATAPGQLAILALANQLARTSRRISFALHDPGVAVLARTPFAGDTLGEVLMTTVREIDPCGEFRLGDRQPGRCVAIGLGAEVGPGFDWYLGADRSIAHLSRSPAAFANTVGTLRGAALASCLGCAAVLREQLGLPVAPKTLSAWNYAEDDAAAPGPESLDVIDVGRVLMVGAGAVGAALAFWLHAFGVGGEGWAVVDRDVVELHNTNRGLVFTARHAGWPEGSPANKALLVAPLIPGATAHDRWYHECGELTERKFDVVLALANDHAVRERLTHRNAAVALQATTGENWLSQLHRHILGRDGCIWCRTGEVKTPAFGCSSGEVEGPDGSRSDAALPFLSAASGLMLATALQRMMTGELTEDSANCWSWDFGSAYRMTSRPAARPCREGCALVPPSAVRQKLTAGTRWAALVAGERRH